MNLSLLDWTVIAAYFLFNLGIGLYYARKADRKSHTSELQSHVNLVCRLLLEKKKKI